MFVGSSPTVCCAEFSLLAKPVAKLHKEVLHCTQEVCPLRLEQITLKVASSILARSCGRDTSKRRLGHSAKVSMYGERAEQALDLLLVGKLRAYQQAGLTAVLTSRTLSENHATRPNSQ